MAFTNPNLQPQWIGPRGFTTNIERFDTIPGGLWRFTHKDNDGNEFAFHGLFHEISAPDMSMGQAGRIIQIFEFEGLPETGNVILDTI